MCVCVCVLGCMNLENEIVLKVSKLIINYSHFDIFGKYNAKEKHTINGVNQFNPV